jgi:hypothetical protein
MTITEAKIKEVTKELARKLVNKEITSRQAWEGLDEIERFKIENKLGGVWHVYKNSN